MTVGQEYQLDLLQTHPLCARASTIFPTLPGPPVSTRTERSPRTRYAFAMVMEMVVTVGLPRDAPSSRSATLLCGVVMIAPFSGYGDLLSRKWPVAQEKNSLSAAVSSG